MARFSRRGADVAENISEVDFLYGNPGRHAQPHTNHKPVFAELADLAKIVFYHFLPSHSHFLLLSLSLTLSLTLSLIFTLTLFYSYY